MTDKRLFLHIGSFKTGSMAIQENLRPNAGVLAIARGLGSLQASTVRGSLGEAQSPGMPHYSSHNQHGSL
jgi:hypothetical protein